MAISSSRRPLTLKPLPRRLCLEKLEGRIVLAEASGLFNDSVLMRTDRGNVPVPASLSGYTVEAWIRRADANRCETVISSGYSVISSNHGYWFGICNGGTVGFQSNTANSALHSGNTFIPANVWTHVAATWTPFEERLYVNGELDAVFAAGFEPNPGQNNLYVGAWRNEYFAGPSTSHYFLGYISEARVWQTVRTQDQIRRTMHEFIEGQPTDLLAAWHLNANFNESVNNLPVTNSNPCICGPAAPPVWRVSEVDANFNVLPAARFYGAGASVPDTNTAYLIGGYDNNLNLLNEIVAMDMSTGDTRVVANLPVAVGTQTATYVAATNSVYVFGGEIGLAAQNSIVRYDLTTGLVTQLAATLPIAHFFGNALWHPGIQRVLLIGGYANGPVTALNTVMLFDPVAETVQTAAVTLPSGRYNAAVAYSPLTDRVYIFGGNDNAFFGSQTRTTWELAINADGTGAVTPLPQADLPLSHIFATAVVDPKTQLIHIVGGSAEYVQTFDPRTNTTWRTRQRMPRNYSNGNNNGAVLNKLYQTVVYSPQNRHALVIGGGDPGGPATRKVWRVPLGDGPAIPIERWDFINSLPTIGSRISEIDGDDRGVYFASQQDGGETIVGINENGQSFLYDPPGFNGSINDIAVNAGGLWAGYSCFGCGTGGGAWNFSNGTATQYGPAQLGTSNVYSLQPDWPFIGTDQGLKSASAFGWNTTLHPNSFDFVWAQTGGNNNTWAVVRDAPPGQSSNQPWRLANVTVNAAGGPTVRDNWPSICGDDFRFPPGGPIFPAFGLTRYNDIVQDHSGNLWVVGWGAGQEAICFMRADSLATTPAGGLATSVLSNRAEAVDVDADNRVWVALRASNGTSGGLTVYELNTTGPTRGQLRNSDYNWLTAPIGSRRLVTGGAEPAWNSTITAVAGVDEKLYAAKEAVGASPGGVVTVAQRWQQLDDLIGNTVVDGIWTVRGRTFFNLGQYGPLGVLQPDGLTYEAIDTNFNPIRVVADDGAGNIWVGTANGPRLYTATGFDYLTDRLGTRPTGNVYAIVEAHDPDPADGKAAPVWLGGDDGLTLFDRNRFVTTFTTANSALPANTVRSILVDTAGNVWAGTTAGLARLSPDLATWTTFTTADGLPNNSIFDLAQLGDGRIAISTASGLSLYDGATFALQSPPISAVNLPLSIDDLGRLWAGSALFTAAGWRGYWSTNSGLKYSTISDTATDGADRIWFSHAPNPGVSVRGTFLPPLKDFTPIITGYSPTSGSAGTIITIDGQSLGSDPSEVGYSVSIGGSAVEIISVTETQVQVRLLAATTSGSVSLVRGGNGGKRTTATTPFCAVPVIHTSTPTGGNAGVEVSVSGTNLDPDATIRIGGGAARPVNGSGTSIGRIVEHTDSSGQIVVQNRCAGATATGAHFNKLNLSIPTILFNQGMPSPLVIEDKATLIQNFISAGGPLLRGEKVEIDEVRETITDRNGFVRHFTTSLLGSGVTPPLVGGPPTAAERMTIASSQNVPNMFFAEWGQNTVRTELVRRGRVVATATTTVDVSPKQTLEVLLVPIMWNTATSADLQAMKRNIDTDLAHVRERMFPSGTVNVVWAEDVIRRDETFTLDNFFNLYYAAPGLDRIRRRHNENPNRPDAQIVMGVVQSTLASGGSAPGFAFGADVSKLINTVVLDDLDSLCDVVNGAVNTLSLGLLGSDDGCHLDIPLYVGWMTGVASAGSTLAHEIGHQLGLVKPWAGNGSWTDNFSHSVNDELPANMECNDWNGTSFDWNKSFYTQPGVVRPIVDPIAGTEFLPTNDNNPNNAMRAKAMMSYACGRNSANTFFEPVDIQQMNHPLVPLIADMIKVAKLLTDDDNSPPAPSSAAPAPAGGPTVPRAPALAPGDAPDTTGPRLHVFGTLDTGADSGEIVRVESYGETAPLTPSFATGYVLVQLDAVGNELARTGIAPLGASPAGDGTTTQFIFSATLRRHAETARLELRMGGIVLDTFAPGAAMPVVQIVQPAITGFYDAGPVTVEWVATDADGDPLEVSVEYSPDNGISWTPIGSASGSGSLNVPLVSLAMRGSGPGRFRVLASDGLRSTAATSVALSVANQPPQVIVDQNLDQAVVLEGRALSLAATAFDPEDGPLGGDGLQWTSSIDGALGTGPALTTGTLSAGVHTITVYATDAQGVVASGAFQLTVVGDYDFDGIDDSRESAAALNPLSPADAASDEDDDGLTLLVEWQLGTNANAVDSDGDGRSDAQEIVDGTDAMTSDAPPVADSLAATVADVTLSVDLAAGTPLPQFSIGVNSRLPADWRLVTDVDWLEATATAGTTPGATLVRVQAFDLPDGQHVAHLRFDSDAIGSSQIVPVTVTVVNREAFFDLDGSGSAAGEDCDLIQSLVGLTIGDSGYDYRFDIDRDGIIEPEDVGACNVAVNSGLPGDFDLDNDVDADDIDLLFAAISSGTQDLFFDLTDDGVVTHDDTGRLVQVILQTSFGDANLDGRVNRTDAAIVGRNFGYMGTPAWARGDFSGDGQVDLTDAAMMHAQLDSVSFASPQATPTPPSALVARRAKTAPAAQSTRILGGSVAGVDRVLGSELDAIASSRIPLAVARTRRSAHPVSAARRGLSGDQNLHSAASAPVIDRASGSDRQQHAARCRRATDRRQLRDP